MEPSLPVVDHGACEAAVEGCCAVLVVAVLLDWGTETRLALSLEARV